MRVDIYEEYRWSKKGKQIKVVVKGIMGGLFGILGVGSKVVMGDSKDFIRLYILIKEWFYERVKLVFLCIESRAFNSDCFNDNAP